MEWIAQVQILDEAVCISHSTHSLSEGTNLNILPSTIEQS